MTGTDILNQLANKDRERLRGYQDLLDFYSGLQWPGRDRYGEKRLTFNYSKIFIDKITSYLMSGIGFTVEAIEDTPEARARAEQAEKAIYRVYEANNLEQLDLETEIDCAILGDACYKVTWDFSPSLRGDSPSAGTLWVPTWQSRPQSSSLRGDSALAESTKQPRLAFTPDAYSSAGRGRVRVTAPDIRNIYAWWVGDDISRIWKVANKYQLSEEEVEMLYPAVFSSIPAKAGIQKSNSLDSVLQRNGRIVTEIWTDHTFDLYLDNTLLESGPNPYGFIPFIIFPNLREPKKFWGTSDVTQIMEPQRELNRAMSQISHILELSGNPVAVLENVEESTDIAVKPGAVWNIPEDAKAYLLDLLQGGGLQRHVEYIELLYRSLQDISETPRAAFGSIEKDLSGTAMQIELYPLLQKVMRKRIIRSTVYNRRNRMILKLMEKFTENRLLNADNFRLRTVWGQVLPQDQARLVDNERVLVETGIHSRRKAMDEVGVKDPESEFRHWIEEQKEVSEIQNSNLKSQK